jgi:hypothetical protein
MSASQGQCAKCTAINTYQSTTCTTCGARLPWANTVIKAAAIVANTSAAATPVSESQGFSAFMASPSFRYVVLAVLLAVAAATYFVVDGMVSSQIAEALSSSNAPQTTQIEAPKGRGVYSKP